MHSSIKRTLGSITNRYQGGIIGSKNQAKEKRSHQIMTLFESQTELIPNGDELPTAKLKHDADLAVYNTPNLKQDFSPDVQLIWSLASVLCEMDKTNQETPLFNWIRDLIQPGLEYQLERQTKMHSDDPFTKTFVYLSFGQGQLASEEAKNQGDYELALFISHSESKDMRVNTIEKLADLRTTTQWNDMSKFHKKCWYAIAGNLGYSRGDDFVVTEGVYWQCVLGMYIWYNDNLLEYNQAINPSDATLDNIKTKKNTACADKECLWYQLLQWWIGDKSVANLDAWPIELPWLLKIYKKPNDIDASYANKFVDDLDTNDLAEWAIYASLFLENSQKKVFYILRQCEWTNEEKLVKEYHIPKKQIQMAKALNAHDSWNYELEYQHLLEGELFDQAKLSLLYFLLPKLFQDNETALNKSLTSLDAYLSRRPDEQILVLQNTYKYLLDQDISVDKDELLVRLSELQEQYKSRSCRQTLSHLIDLIQTKQNKII